MLKPIILIGEKWLSSKKNHTEHKSSVFFERWNKDHNSRSHWQLDLKWYKLSFENGNFRWIITFSWLKVSVEKYFLHFPPFNPGFNFKNFYWATYKRSKMVFFAPQNTLIWTLFSQIRKKTFVSIVIHAW